MFGATGSTNIYDIAHALRSGSVPPLAYVAVALMFVGLGFKVASAPFHVWTPGCLRRRARAGGGAHVHRAQGRGLCRAAAHPVRSRRARVVLADVGLGRALDVLGNLGALVQTNVKRLLAYSSIAHAGYLLVAFAALHAASAFPPPCSTPLRTRP